MASVNRVTILGNLGADPELRYTQNQTAVATLSVATKEFSKDREGQKQEFTEWHRVVVWGRQAENASKYLAKGRQVYVEGRLQTRSWDDKTGVKRYSTEVVALNLQFLGGGRDQAAGGYQGQGQGQEMAPPSQDFQQQAPDSGGFGGPSTPSIDEIPF